MADSAKSPDPGTEKVVKELLDKQGIPLDGNVSVNVTTRRYHQNPDGSRTLISESTAATNIPVVAWAGRAIARIAWLCIIVGAVQFTYWMWADRSDSAAAPLYLGAPECQLRALTASDGRPTSGAICRADDAVVIALNRSSGRGGRRYDVVTVTPNGNRDNTPVEGYAGYRLWRRLKPAQRITVQRFVAPGYHLTGMVTAFADDSSAAMTRHNPALGTGPDVVMAVLGATFVLLGGALLVRRPWRG